MLSLFFIFYFYIQRQAILLNLSADLIILHWWCLKVCAYKDGEVIIDTAAGVLGRYDPRPVQPDSLFPVFSVTKGITAGMIHWLVDKGYVIVIMTAYCCGLSTDKLITWMVLVDITFV